MSEHQAQTCANREHVNILEVELVQGTEHENPLDGKQKKVKFSGCSSVRNFSV